MLIPVDGMIISCRRALLWAMVALPMAQSNPRQAHTRQLLRETLIVLVIEMPYNAATITDITKRARVARKMFYAQYINKDPSLIDCIRSPLSNTSEEHLQNQPRNPTNSILFSIQTRSGTRGILSGDIEQKWINTVHAISTGIHDAQLLMKGINSCGRMRHKLQLS